MEGASQQVSQDAGGSLEPGNLTTAPTPTVPVSWSGQGPWQELIHDVCGSGDLPAWRQWGHHSHHR